MTTLQTDAVPYQRQVDAETERRMCGAAALSMVYRSFGLDVSQQSLWPSITGRNSLGNIHAKSFLLCRDALSRGFLGLVVKASQPWEMLERSRRPGVQAIVNHRIISETGAGHYSVVVACDNDGISLHDPRMGPDRRLTRDEFLSLWQPSSPRSEITGNIAVILTRRIGDSHICPACQTMMPPAFQCASCKRTVPLQPGVVLGCVSPRCSEKLWATLYCPFCDHATDAVEGWNPSSQLPSRAPIGPSPSTAPPGKPTPFSIGEAAKRAHAGAQINGQPVPQNLTSALETLRAVFARPELAALDTVSRERLQSILTRIEAGRDQVKDYLEPLVTEWQAKAIEYQRKAEEMAARLAKPAEVALDSHKTTPPHAERSPTKERVPPVVEDVSLDPTKGMELRERLLSRFSPLPASATSSPAGVDDRMDWKDWLDPR